MITAPDNQSVMLTLRQPLYPSIIGAIGIALIGLFFFQFIRTSDKSFENQPVAQKINLALRRTAHHLLVKAGDTTSRIAPVQQLTPETFQIRLERNLDYNALPALLQQSFALHQITDEYDVSVLDCQNGELQLGYNIRDFIHNKSVPCVGRSQASGCYNLQVTFSHPLVAQASNSRWWFLLGGGVLTVILFTLYRYSKPVLSTASGKPQPVFSQPIDIESTEPSSAPSPLAAWSSFGNSQFDRANQLLLSGANRHELTYREAKLLHLFVHHLNQVLERDFILKSVWEDEGVIVGRSADVFVSRLRKLLKEDPTVRIVAVHGVGYRMEVRADN